MKSYRLLLSLFFVFNLLTFTGCENSAAKSQQIAINSQSPAAAAQTDSPVTPVPAAASAAATNSEPTPTPAAWMDDYKGLEIFDDERNEIARCSSGSEARDNLNYFLQAMISQVNVDLQTELKISEAEAQDIIFNRNTRIFSTMNQDMQEIMEKVITDTSYYPPEAAPGLQAAMVIMDYHTSQVKALSGGRDKDYTGVNRATDLLRQPGSSFQVLAGYAPAIDLGLLNADSTVVDEPFTVDGYQPQNWWGNSYKGDMTVRQAVAQSANVIAVKVGVETGLDKCFDYIQKFHFTTIVNNENINGQTFTDKTAAMLLGGLTYGVRLLELTAAYGAIADDGAYNAPVFYTKICDNEGKDLLQSKPSSEQI